MDLRLIALLAFFSLSAPAFGATADAFGLAPRRLILSIGIGAFRDPTWQPLRYAAKDAHEVYDAFLHTARFDGGEVLAPRPGELLSKGDIERALRRLAEANRNDNDTVVIYISSHGTLLSRPQGVERYIVTSNSDHEHLDETSFAFQELIKAFQRLRSRRKALILAFCYSGNGKSGLTPQMKREVAQMKGFYQEPLEEASEGAIILAASGWQEPALEAADLQNDIYTHFLLRGFDQDANGDGVVSLTEAHHFAARETYRFSGGRQRPSATMELLGAEPIFLRKPAKVQMAPMLYAYFSNYAHLEVDVDGKARGNLAKGLAMPEGQSRLRVTDPENGQVVLDRVVSFEAGHEYPIAKYLEPGFPHQITIGMTQMVFPSGKVDRSYAPTPMVGVSFRFLQDEAFGVYDAGVSAAFFAPVQEGIEADGQTFRQERSMASAAAFLGRHQRLGAWSGQRFVTQARFFGGSGLLWYRRQVEEEAFLQQKNRGVSPGLMLGFGLEALVPYSLLVFGLDARLAGNSPIYRESSPILFSGQIGGYLGAFW